LLLILSLLLAAFSGILCWQVFRQKALIDQMMQTNEMTTDDITSPGHDPELVITLRVIDPIALAKRESRSARVLADKLPVMVRKMVYQEVMKELKAELTERDIEADMQIEYR
jgi:hypothetical protein